jgi:hypothetical protein
MVPYNILLAKTGDIIMYKKLLILLVVGFFCIAWTNNPGINTPVCTASQEQKRPQLAADGAGGAVVVWEDSRNGTDYDIYAQRIDSKGIAQWRAGGVPLCAAIGHQRFPQITADSSGGFIVTWFDRRSGKHYDIYSQRIDSTGRVRWSADGVPICTAPGDQYDPTPVSDNSGGAIIVWQDRRNGNDYDIYAQCIGASGRVKWDANGVVLCSAAGDQDTFIPVSDGRGGVVVAWQDRRSGRDYDLYVQRVDANGTVQWGSNGVAVCAEKDDQRLPQMVADKDGNVILTWQDKRNSTDYDIYTQRVDASGTVAWTVNGIAICKEANSQYEPRLAADGDGGAFITWQDYRKGADCNFEAFDKKDDIKAAICDEKQLSDWNIFAQHINVSGRVQWAANGVTISTSNVDHFKPRAISDGFGGTIITWRAADKETDHNIYAQRLDSTGRVRWADKGVAVCTAPGDQVDPLLVADGQGGAIVTWYDKRKGNSCDIYAQKICASGEIGGCSQPVAVIGADRFSGEAALTVTFQGAGSYDPDGRITSWNWNFGDGKRAASENVTHTYTNPGTYTVTLKVRDNNGKWSSTTRKRVKVNPKKVTP